MVLHNYDGPCGLPDPPTAEEHCAAGGHDYYADDFEVGRCYCGHREFPKGGPEDERVKMDHDSDKIRCPECRSEDVSCLERPHRHVCHACDFDGTRLQIVSMPPSADAVTGHPLPAAGSSADASVSSAGIGNPRPVSGHQERKEGER